MNPREVEANGEFRVPFNDLSRRDPEDLLATTSAMRRVIDRGNFILGPEVHEFEREFADFIGTAHCVGVASGSDAIEIALRSLGCGSNDEVVTAANAGGYSAIAALNVGATPIFADVDSINLNLTAETVGLSLTDKTKAVIVTHLFGRLAQIEEITKLCRANGVFVIEDCAQAVGATRDGKLAGAFGDIGVFSFYPTKNLGAFGDAGAIVSNSDEWSSAARSLRQYGWSSRNQIVRAGGRNSRLDEIQASVLRVRLSFLAQWNSRRREIAASYAAVVGGGGASLLTNQEGEFVAHLAVVRPRDRPKFLRALDASRIGWGIHFEFPDYLQAGLRGAIDSVSLPETERSCAQVVSLPCFPLITDREVQWVCRALESSPCLLE